MKRIALVILLSFIPAVASAKPAPPAPCTGTYAHTVNVPWGAEYSAHLTNTAVYVAGGADVSITGTHDCVSTGWGSDLRVPFGTEVHSNAGSDVTFF